MMRWLCVIFFALFLIGGVSGCSEETATAPAAKKPKAAAKSSVQTVAPQPTDTVSKTTADEKFVYQADGRRDPFVPLTALRKPVGDSSEPMTPLQRYELDQYRLLGVIVGMNEPRAMVKAPDGKSYILTKGLKIGKNGGVITDINSQVILVEEKFYDFSGNVRSNIQEISVPKR